ncbi:MAG: SDR family oxidoreductase [Myxococcota bacterium]
MGPQQQFVRTAEGRKTELPRVLVAGGAGYVGSALVPALLRAGYPVTVLDLYLYGAQALAEVRNHQGLREVQGDLRDGAAVQRALQDCKAVIHLACISNDPSFELNPNLGRSINYDAFRPLVRAAKEVGVERFIYASSSSVYGVKEDPEVTEALPLEPLTDYSKYKALCEDVLDEERCSGFTTVVLRPSTVCGYAPRLRLDVVVNILTNHAAHNRRIRVFGGSQMRPNIHISDMVDAYLHVLEQPAQAIDGEVFNVGYDNFTVMELAETVRQAVDAEIPIEVVPTDDIRSYHVSSEKIRSRLSFFPKKTVADAVQDLLQAFDQNKVSEPLTNSLYFNLKRMQEYNLR